MVTQEEQPTSAPPFQVDHPWSTAALAPLFDCFPFTDDIAFYQDLASAAGETVLEIACGSGRVLVPLVEGGFRVVGVDASAAMLDLARAKLAAADPASATRARLVEGDMRSFEVEGPFDLAFIAVKSFAYLQSRGEQEQALTAIAQHLRPGGLFAIDLLNPAPAWLLEPPGSLRQDLFQYVPRLDATVSRTETVVSTDLAAQVRVVRSVYEIVTADGSVTKRFVEWPYRYTYRFEAEHLIERAGFAIEALHGGYGGEPFTSDSRTMLFVARRKT